MWLIDGREKKEKENKLQWESDESYVISEFNYVACFHPTDVIGRHITVSWADSAKVADARTLR